MSCSRDLPRRHFLPLLLGFAVLIGAASVWLEAASVLMEARHRAWLLTGDAEFVRRRKVAFEEAGHEAQELAQLVSDNPPQVARTREALAAVAARNTAMQQAVGEVATVVPNPSGDLVLFYEAERLPLDRVATLLSRGYGDCGEVAERLHTRIDVEWPSLDAKRAPAAV